MGFWSRVKGVFGRIGSGIKKGFNWLVNNKEKVADTLNTASQFLPDKYKGQAQEYIKRGSEYIDKGDAMRQKIGFI